MYANAGARRKFDRETELTDIEESLEGIAED
jgi:hypothetical protein